MPELFARPLGPDGEPVGPMRRLGTVEKIVTARNPFLDDLGWDGRPIRTDRPSVPIEVTFPRRSITLGTWVLLLTNAADAPPPVSRGSAWRDGAYAACQHQLTGPPEPPPRPRFPSWQTAVYPRWYLDWMVWQMRHACAELFDPYEWLATRQAGTARTVARDYPPPAEPCQECIAFGQTWRDRLRALYDAFLAAPEPVRPTVRTDFMPRYPGVR